MSKISIGYIRRGEEGNGIFSMTKRYHLPFTVRNIFSDSGDVGGGETNMADHQEIDETLKQLSEAIKVARVVNMKVSFTD